MADPQINDLIASYKALQLAAKQTVSALQQSKAAIGSGGGLTANAGSLGAAGSTGTNNNTTSSVNGKAPRIPVSIRNTTAHGANRAVREKVKLSQGLFELGQSLAEGDAEGTISAIGHVAKDLKDFGLGRSAVAAGATILSVRAGLTAAEEIRKKEYGSAVATILGSAAQGAMVAGAPGALIAGGTATIFALARKMGLPPYIPSMPTWKGFNIATVTSFYSSGFDADAMERKNLNDTIQGFKKIYGGKTPTAKTIDKMINDGMDEEKIKEQVEKSSKLIEDGYHKVGMGLFGKGKGEIERGYTMMSKTGLLTDTPIVNPAQIFNMLESQRFAIKNYAFMNMARAGSRTGD